MNEKKLVENFTPLIKASIKNYFKNNTSYEDAFQDGVLKILELNKSFKGDGKISLECYLKYQLKYFYMQKFFKQKQKSEQQIEISDNTNNNTDFFDNIKDDVDIEQELFKKELKKILNNSINSLPKKQRMVIILKFFKSMKNKEIAKSMNIKEYTVKEYYKIAKNKLKKDLSKITEIL